MLKQVEAKDELFNPAEAGAYMRKSRRTVFNYIAKESLPCIKLSKRSVVLRKSDIDGWMASRRVCKVRVTEN